MTLQMAFGAMVLDGVITFPGGCYHDELEGC